MMTTTYWERALAAIDRRRLEMIGKMPEDPEDPVWREIANLNWIEQYAHYCLSSMQDMESL